MMDYPSRFVLPHVLKMLEAGGTYGVAVEGSDLQVVVNAPDGSCEIWGPHILAKNPPLPEICLDLALMLDAFLAFWAGQENKVKSYLRTLHLPRTDDAQLCLFKVLMSPRTWSENMTPEERHKYLKTSVWNGLREANPHLDPHPPEPLASPDESGGFMPLSEPEEQVANGERRAWLLGQSVMTERDLEVVSLILEGKSPADASRAVGGPELSPWITVKQKLALRKPPDKLF